MVMGKGSNLGWRPLQKTFKRLSSHEKHFYFFQVVTFMFSEHGWKAFSIYVSII